MVTWTGWLATIAIIVAALVPIVARIALKKRAAPASLPVRSHVVIGLVTSVLAFAHTMTVLPALGSPAATGGGMTALLPAGLAFVVLVAHAGLGLQLRDPRLKDRQKKRRTHAVTAIVIAACVAVHVVALELAVR